MPKLTQIVDEDEQMSVTGHELKDLFKRTEVSGNRIIGKIKIIENAVENEDREMAQKNIIELVRLCNEISKRMQKIVIYEDMTDDFLSALYEPIEIKGNVENFDGTEYLHLRMECLPPYRPVNRAEISYMEINATYGKSFIKFFDKFREINNFELDEKSVLLMRFNYANKRNIKDHDNFELKRIIDVIASNVLPDDSPYWCAQFYDYSITPDATNNSTDIYVIPFSLFLSHTSHISPWFTS